LTPERATAARDCVRNPQQNPSDTSTEE
jgi:hypothetical protein